MRRVIASAKEIKTIVHVLKKLDTKVRSNLNRQDKMATDTDKMGTHFNYLVIVDDFLQWRRPSSSFRNVEASPRERTLTLIPLLVLIPALMCPNLRQHLIHSLLALGL